MPKKKQEELPDVIFVTTERDGNNGSFLVACKDVEDFDTPGVMVATYQRISLGTLEVTKKIVEDG